MFLGFFQFFFSENSFLKNSPKITMFLGFS